MKALCRDILQNCIIIEAFKMDTTFHVASL